MIDRVLLDTDVLSEVSKAIDPNVTACASSYIDEFDGLEITSASVLEILSSLYRKEAFVKIHRAETFFALKTEVVPVREDYRLAARIEGALVRRGTSIGNMDPLIAACALNRDLTVATGNTRHFGYIQSTGFPLRLQDWRNP